MKTYIGSLGRCIICGGNIYDSFEKKRSWIRTEEGVLHQECYKRCQAEEKNNKILEVSL